MSIRGVANVAGGSGGKESTCNVGDPSLIPGLGRSPGEGISYLLQYSSLASLPMGLQRVTTEQLSLSGATVFQETQH